MTQYRRRDVYNCYQHTGDWADFMRWIDAVNGAPLQVTDDAFPDVSRNPDGSLSLVTSMGLMVARKGDWVFQSSKGECLAIAGDVFLRVFEPVEGATDAPVMSLVMDPPEESPTGEATITPIEPEPLHIEWPSATNWEENVIYAFQVAESNPAHVEEIGLLLIDWFKEPAEGPPEVLTIAGDDKEDAVIITLPYDTDN